MFALQSAGSLRDADRQETVLSARGRFSRGSKRDRATRIVCQRWLLILYRAA